MTFSLIARCPITGQFGIAAATAVPAVGKLLTHAAPGTGAVATQARLNPYLGIDGMDLLHTGASADIVLETLSTRDPGWETRQVAIIDRHGHVASWTGGQCLDWAGHMIRDSFGVQGNRLASPAVLERAADTFVEREDLDLVDRLITALAAGDREGGDRKGEVSATVYVIDQEDYPIWDIRVDYHPTPIDELIRFADIMREQLYPHVLRMPTRANPAGELDSKDEDDGCIA